MQFESRIKRSFWINAALGLIPDTTIAAIIAVFSREGWPVFFAVLIGLQVVYFLIWLKDTIWHWLFFTIRGRKQMASFLLDVLTTNKYPEPGDHERSIEGYFDRIASDDAYPVGVRIRAAAEVGALKVPAAHGHLQDSIRIEMAYEDALEEYKHTFNRLGG